MASGWGGRRLSQLSAELCMNVVAPQLGLKSHMSWHSLAEYPAF